MFFTNARSRWVTLFLESERRLAYSPSNIFNLFFPMLTRFKIISFLFFSLAMASLADAAPGDPRGGAMAPEAESGRISFRVAYWSQPNGEAPKYYVRDGRDYKFLQIYEMSFARPSIYRGRLPIQIFRRATAKEVELRRANPDIKKSDIEYVPAFTINIPRGMNDVGVILLPGDPTKTRPIVFDFKENAFPYGSTRIVSLARVPLGLKFGKENSLLNPGVNRGYCSKPIENEREIIEIKIAVHDGKEWKITYSSAAAFRRMSRYIIFVLPVAGDKQNTVGTFQIRRITLDKPQEIAPPQDDAKAPADKKNGTPPPPPRGAPAAARNPR